MKIIRIKNKLTQRELSILTGISQNYISELENGRYKSLTIDKLLILASALKVSPCTLLESLIDK